MIGYKKVLTGLLYLFSIMGMLSTFQQESISTNAGISNVEPPFRTPYLRGTRSKLVMTPSETDDMTPRNTDNMMFGMSAQSFFSEPDITASAITASSITASALTGSSVSTSIIAGTGLTLFNTWAGKKLVDLTTPLFSTGLKKHVQNMSSKDLSKILNGAMTRITDAEIDILIEKRKFPGWSKGKIGKLIRKVTTSFLPSGLKGFIVKRIVLNMDEAKAAQLFRDLPVSISKSISSKLHVRKAYVYILTSRLLRVLTECVYNVNLILLESALTKNALEICMKV